MVNSPLPGTADATTKPQRLVEKHGRTPAQASLFNHASMACNNHMFFNCLSPQRTEPSPSFAADLNESFSSYDTLRTEMIETADAMFGPGFVWIVKDQEAGKMKLLCTYLAGSPYPLAHLRSQQTVPTRGRAWPSSVLPAATTPTRSSVSIPGSTPTCAIMGWVVSASIWRGGGIALIGRWWRIMQRSMVQSAGISAALD
jgi:superoxide dismutase